MWSIEEFDEHLGERAVIGMVHLQALPGAPGFRGSLDEVTEAAITDANAIAAGGADALLIENFGDRPFRRSDVDDETVAALTFVTTEIRRNIRLPFGINVLRNDSHAALAIAAVTSALFIRVNILIGAVVTDQGVIEGQADTLLRKRRELECPAAIFADHLVKHASPLAPVQPVQQARDLRLRGGADAIIITGAATGVAAERSDFEVVRSAVPGTPIIAGSGVDAGNAGGLRGLADAVIVGTSIKRNGQVDRPVDQERVARVCAAFKKA